MFKSKGDQIDDVPYSDVPTNGGVDVSKFSVDDVCELIISLHLDPLPFKENAVEGADLLELTDVELAEYLGLKPLQIRKIRKRLAELSAQDPEEENEREIRSISIFRKYEEQMKSLPPQQEPQSGNQQESHPSSGFVSQSRFTDARGGEFDKPLNDMSNLKPCERGLVEGVYAGDGAEEAPRDETFEKEIFNLPNTGIDFDKFSAIPAEATGNNVPKPISTFAEANFHKLLAENVALAKYKNPTPVQRYGIAVAMAGRDMMACAQTGSGKTAAFLFPVISTLLTRGRTQADLVHQELGVRRRVYPDACILCPTRELALQIYDEARKFTYRSFVHAAVVYGGADPKGQLIQIKKGCHILIATPGRLNQMVERGHISLSKIFFLILDEADRMLDMGFEPQIRQIVENHDLPKTGTRQTLMFSATFPREVQTLAGEFLQDYIFLTVGRVGSASTTITQDVQYVEENDKHDNLMRLLSTHNKGLTLVFVQTKKEADTLEEYVRRQGFPSTSLNGDRAQWEREDALESFRTGKTPVMIATDVAQRGLDIPNVNHVINFDMPANIDDYVHRIGRTGRVGNHGLATSFFNDQDTTLAADLVVVLKEANQAVPDWLEACAMEATGGRTRYKFNSRDSRSERPRRDEGPRGGGFDNGSKSFDSESSFNSTPARSNGGGADLWD